MNTTPALLFPDTDPEALYAYMKVLDATFSLDQGARVIELTEETELRHTTHKRIGPGPNDVVVMDHSQRRFVTQWKTFGRIREDVGRGTE